jgi:hypothetical protein
VTTRRSLSERRRSTSPIATRGSSIWVTVADESSAVTARSPVDSSVCSCRPNSRWYCAKLSSPGRCVCQPRKLEWIPDRFAQTLDTLARTRLDATLVSLRTLVTEGELRKAARTASLLLT